MNPETRRAIGQQLGAVIRRLRPVAGGDINDAYAAELDDGRRVFVKANDDAPHGLFTAEAHGLAWLRRADAVRVPEVLAVADVGVDHGAFLVLAWLQPSPAARDADERLGAALAALHRSGNGSFGLERDNFIGLLPQSNSPRATWAEFFRDQRLMPQLDRARKRDLIDAATERALDRVLGRLEELVGPSEPPARLHGDLWGGNLLHAKDGEPFLIDPAAYAGHREIDLAMMRLFGGFSRRVFEAYEAAYPLAPGHLERVPLYQLYPLLVHVNIFGASYVAAVHRALARYL